MLLVHQSLSWVHEDLLDVLQGEVASLGHEEEGEGRAQDTDAHEDEEGACPGHTSLTQLELEGLK